MKRSLISPPDDFSSSPFLALLPVKGKVAGLAGLSTSLFARLEKVQAIQRELGEDEDKAILKRFAAEEAMLKQVLDWLSLHPEQHS